MHKYITLTLNGDHYTMGWQHGCQVKKLRMLIVQAMDARFEQLKRDGYDKGFNSLLQETQELLRDDCAPLLDMIRGQAEALEIDFDLLMRYNLAVYLRDHMLVRKPLSGEGCTTWAATGSATANGQPILVKNRDYRLDHLPLQVVIRAIPERGYRYIYVSSAGSPGVFCAGLNQAGLAVADTHVCSTDLGSGLPDYALMMNILESHDTVSSAVDYLRLAPRMGRNNLILADAQGHMAVFEIGHRHFGLFENRDGTLVNANHFISSELRSCFVDTSPPQMKGNSFYRYDKVEGELSAALGLIDVPFAQQLMATHGEPISSICRHPTADSDSATISTSIFLPAQRTMLFCHGLPCRDQYDEFVL